jgi:tetratricopeptide (TPR) repeat protein
MRAATTLLFVTAVACEKPGGSGVTEEPWRELDTKLEAAIETWQLAEAEAMLAELAESGAPPARIDYHRVQLGDHLMRPEVFRGAPVKTQRSSIEFYAGLPAGTTEPGCGASWSDRPVLASDPRRARELFHEAGALREELDAAYRAGDLEPFEDAWKRADAELRTVDTKARRARILAHHGKTDEAAKQAEEILADAVAGKDLHCSAALLLGKLHEQRGRLVAARESYERASALTSFGQCGHAARARVATLQGRADGDTIVGQDVRVWLQLPQGAEARVVLKAHEPSPDVALLRGWMNEDDPSSWHNADTFVATAGIREGTGAWHFDDVWPGWYTLVVIVDGEVKARPGADQCLAGVHVVDERLETNAVTIVWE